jgi:hypothetical protein
VVRGELTLDRPLKIDGVLLDRAPPGESLQIVAAFPDARVEPLLWRFYQREKADAAQARPCVDLNAGQGVLALRQ